MGLIFVVKLFVNNKGDEATDKWRRIFEVPADLTMLAFMMGLAGTAALKVYNRESQIALLVIIVLSVISVAIFKQNCATVSAKGGIVQFDTKTKATAWFFLNTLIAVTAIIMSYKFLSANES